MKKTIMLSSLLLVGSLVFSAWPLFGADNDPPSVGIVPAPFQDDTQAHHNGFMPPRQPVSVDTAAHPLTWPEAPIEILGLPHVQPSPAKAFAWYNLGPGPTEGPLLAPDEINGGGTMYASPLPLLQVHSDTDSRGSTHLRPNVKRPYIR